MSQTPKSILRTFSVSLLAFTVISLTSCGSKTEKAKPEGGFLVKGSLSQKPMAYLKELNGTTLKTIDSSTISPEGAFSFAGKVPEKGFYVIDINGAQQQLAVLSNTDITITADGRRGGKFSIDGVEENAEFQKVEDLKSKYADLFSALQTSASATTTDAEITAKTSQIQAQLDTEAKALITSLDTSIVAIYACTMLRFDKDFPFLDGVAKKFKKYNPDGKYTKQFVAQLNQFAMAAGNLAPEIEQKSPTGETFKLSSLRGKVVLVDFWASWCGPCRRQNPNVVALYKKYEAKGFTVLGVSLDSDAQKWKEAITKDGLTWHHVSELNRWDNKAASAFQVNEIPTAILIDKSGKIIGRNLEGEGLDKAVKMALGM